MVKISPKKFTEIMVSEFKSNVFWTEGQRDFTLKSKPILGLSDV
jgi:hypothetical protein